MRGFSAEERRNRAPALARGRAAAYIVVVECGHGPVLAMDCQEASVRSFVCVHVHAGAPRAEIRGTVRAYDAHGDRSPFRIHEREEEVRGHERAHRTQAGFRVASRSHFRYR